MRGHGGCRLGAGAALSASFGDGLGFLVVDLTDV